MPYKGDSYKIVQNESDIPYKEIIKNLTVAIQELQRELSEIKNQKVVETTDKQKYHFEIFKDDHTQCYSNDSSEVENSGDKYIWKIKDISLHQETSQSIKNDLNKFYYVRSAPFYIKGGYRVCLLMYPNGFGSSEGDYLSVFFALLSGVDDEKLDWPAKLNFKVNIMDRDFKCSRATGKATYKASREKTFCKPDPNSSRNRSFGTSALLEQSKLQKHFGLILYDTLEVHVEFPKGFFF